MITPISYEDKRSFGTCYVDSCYVPRGPRDSIMFLTERIFFPRREDICFKQYRESKGFLLLHEVVFWYLAPI